MTGDEVCSCFNTYTHKKTHRQHIGEFLFFVHIRQRQNNIVYQANSSFRTKSRLRMVGDTTVYENGA